MRAMVYEAFQQPHSIQSVVDPAPDKDGQKWSFAIIGSGYHEAANHLKISRTTIGRLVGSGQFRTLLFSSLVSLFFR